MKNPFDQAERFLLIALGAGADLLNLGFLLRLVSGSATQGEAWALFAVNIALFGITTAWFIIKSGERDGILTVAISGMGAAAYLPIRVLGLVLAFGFGKRILPSPLKTAGSLIPDKGIPALRIENIPERKVFKKISLTPTNDT